MVILPWFHCKKSVEQVSRFLTDKAEYDTDSKEWIYKTPKPGTTSDHLQSAHESIPRLVSVYGMDLPSLPCSTELSYRTKAQGRTLSITPKQRIAAETRKQIEDKDQHRINTSKRAAIEGTNSAIKSRHGAGKLRVRSHHKCRIIFGFTIMAHNFKQLLLSVKGDIRRSLQEAAR